MTTHPAYVALGGGLDLVTPPTRMNPGRLLGAVNYEAPITGGYRSVSGYTAYATATGTGAILGVVLFKGVAYCIRRNGTYAKLYKLVAGVWTDVTGAVNLPVGRYEFAIGNFQALSYTETLFMQCANTGQPYQYDGTTLAVIAAAPTGGKWLAIHYNHLFVGFVNGSLQHSVLGNPTDWGVGAGEIGVQSAMTGLSSTLGVLMVGCEDSIKILSGESVDNWVLKVHSPNTGVKAYSIAEMVQPYFAHERGLTSLQATQSYGDFVLGGWGASVAPLFFGTGRTPAAALVSREKSQYRLFFNDKTGVYCTPMGKEVACTTVVFPDQISCAWSGEAADGSEVLLIGDDAGAVYQLDSGTSFAGEAIESYMTIAFNNFGAPTVEKRVRRLYLEILSESGATGIKVLPLFNYGDAEISRHRVNYIDALGAGGFWGVSDWSAFRWGSPIQDDREVFVTAIARNMGLATYHSSASEDPHTITGYTAHIDPRRLRRG